MSAQRAGGRPQWRPPRADVELDVLFAPYGAPAQTGKSRGCKSRLTKE